MKQPSMSSTSGEFKIDSVGEVDGKSFVEHLTLFHPGMQSPILGFINAAKNANLMFIVVDNDSQMYLMGDELRSAVYAGAPDGAGTGKDTAARKDFEGLQLLCKFIAQDEVSLSSMSKAWNIKSI